MEKVNLGCGNMYLKNHINCDKNTKYKADKYFDMALPNWPFSDNTIDYVLAKHCLEHLTLDGYFNAFKEIYRICKPNGVLEIHFPHHLSNNFFNDPTHKIRITVAGLDMFSKELNRNWQKSGMSNSQLAMELDIDFLVFKKSYIVNESELSKIGMKNYTMEDIQRFEFIFGNIVDELEVQLRVIK